MIKRTAIVAAMDIKWT